MDTFTKIELAKNRSLMERMDKHYTKYEADAVYEKQLLREGIVKERVQVTRDQILDILDKQDDSGNGQYVSMTYVKPVSVKKTKKSWDKANVDSVLSKYAGSQDAWYNDLNDFNSDDTKLKKNPISSIVVAQRYTLHWNSREKYNKSYSAYSDALKNLRMKYGIGIQSDGMLGDNKNQRTISNDETFNQTGKLARDFNIASSRVKVTNYIVDDAGHIISEIPNDITKAISSQKKEYTIESEVANALAQNPQALQEYQQAKAELDKTFKARNFIFDKILSIVATVNGVGYFYINDKLTTPIAAKSEINVDQTEMVKIAEEQLQQSFNDIAASEFSN